jgi:hypothetical protein
MTNKRGRKYKTGIRREANGRASRSYKPKEDAKLVATEARQRVYGLSVSQSTHEHAGSAVGRLWLSGAITNAEREAGDRYRELHDKAMKAIKAPVGLAVGGTPGSGGDLVTDEYIDWAIKATAHYRTIQDALQDISCRHAIERLVISDEDCPSAAAASVVRVGLSMLVNKLGISEEGLHYVPS